MFNKRFIFLSVCLSVRPCVRPSYRLSAYLSISSLNVITLTVTVLKQLPPYKSLHQFHYNCRYVEGNTKLCHQYKHYDQKVPPYLQNRPRHIIAHCIDKRSLAEAIPDHYVVQSGEGQFRVHSQTAMLDLWYEVST